MATRTEMLTEFLERRCSSLCLDNDAERHHLAVLLISLQALAPTPESIYQAIKDSLATVLGTEAPYHGLRDAIPGPTGLVHAISKAQLDQMARNAAQAVLATFSEE